MTVTEKTLIGFVDVTPTWSELLPRMLHFMANGTDEQRSLLRDDFERMARCADAYLASRRP